MKQTQIQFTRPNGGSLPVPPELVRAYEQIDRELNAGSAQDTLRLWQRAQDLIREQGIHVGAASDARVHERNLPIDLYPQAIAEQDWDYLQRGLTQRIRAWNFFLRDIYTSQEILKADVVPFELVYDDPRFQRCCVNVPVMRDLYLHVMATDILRDKSGRWLVLEDHVANPTGAAYAIQIRRVLSQVCPDLMEGLSIVPIHQYPTQLLETLQYAGPNGPSSARVVLLAPGIEDESFYDHSLLARQMGIPLVQVGDLTVLDSQLYLKTITGLEKVDVVYRRMNTDWVDPVSFHVEARSGVAGLLSCVRKGTASVANALGAGLVENRALAAFLPKMVEFYLNERVLLSAVPTRLCDDVDVREDVLENLDRFIIRPARKSGPEAGWVGRALDTSKRNLVREQLTAHGSRYVAQSIVEVAHQPSWSTGLPESAPVSLRLFVLQGATVQVSPCALTLTKKLESRDGQLHLREVGAKDTWILSESASHHTEADPGFRPVVRRMRLSSRAADCLFWIGRYAERAEATILMLNVVQQLRLEGQMHQDTQVWNPLWEALATAMGHPTSFFKRANFRNALSLAQYVLLDQKNLSSGIACLRSCRQNAQQVRETISPEVWTSLNSIYLKMETAARQTDTEEVQEQIESLTFHNDLLEKLDELSGCVEKHMLHNDAWHFWQIGQHIERAMLTIFTMRQIFLKLQDERATGGSKVDSVNLDALLRMRAGQYAYRSSYLSRPNAPQVARLLLQDEDFPRSVTYCLQNVRTSLRRCFGERPNEQSATLLHHCEHVLSELFITDIRAFFTGEAKPSGPARAGAQEAKTLRGLADWLDSVTQRLLGLGALVADYYVDQQARVFGASE